MSKYAYMLRTCNADMTSYNGFRWPKKGEVVAPDWSPEPVCGKGLHGALHGKGDGTLLSWAADAKWLVVRVLLADVVDLGGKVKVPNGVVVYCGDRAGATGYLAAHGCTDCVIGGTATAGNGGTATAGNGGTATAGYYGSATAGDRGTATAGYRGTATAGYRGTATAGNGGTATAGNGGTATAGNGGTATAGNGGTLILSRWDGIRRRLHVAYVGEGGILPNTPYKLDDKGNFVAVEAAKEGQP